MTTIATAAALGLLGRAAILAVQDLAHEDVPVPEWGGVVRIRAMTGLERDAFGATLRDADGKPDLSNYPSKLLAHCIAGEDGVRLFSVEDIQALAGKSAAALARLFAVADRLNAVGEDAVRAAEKNLLPDPSAASS